MSESLIYGGVSPSAPWGRDTGRAVDSRRPIKQDITVCSDIPVPESLPSSTVSTADSLPLMIDFAIFN